MRVARPLLPVLVTALTATGLISVPATADNATVRPQPSIESMLVHGEGANSDPAVSPDLSAALSSLQLDQEVYSAQSEVLSLTGDFARSHPDTYVGAGMGGAGGPTWIAFTEQPTPGMIDLITALPIDVEVRWGYAASQAERATAIDFAVAAVASQIGLDGVLSGVPDLTAIDIQFRWQDRTTPSEDQLASLEELALAATAEHSDDSLAPLPIAVTYNEHLAGAPEAEIWGGGQLRLTDGRPWRTSGWSVTRGGEEGIITAGHCENLMRFGNNAGWIQFVTEHPVTPAGNWVDMQFHLALSSDAIPRIRASSMTVFRKVFDVENPIFDQSVCHWGMTTGYGCTVVVNTFACYKYADATRTYCGLAYTSGHITANGDSGGPWFWDNTALGTHTGSVDHDDNGATPSLGAFTMISMASTYLAATVQQY